MDLGRWLLLTSLESFATVCVERGIFFFAHQHLGFSTAACPASWPGAGR